MGSNKSEINFFLQNFVTKKYFLIKSTRIIKINNI